MENNHQNQDPISDIEETLDGNFQITVDGDYLRQNIPLFGSNEPFTIDLNISKYVRIIHKSKFLQISSFYRNSRELLMKNIKKVTKEIQQTQNDEINTFKAVQSFFKKYGLHSLSIEIINSYVSNLVHKARDKNDPNKDTAKNKIKKLAVAMCFRRRTNRIYDDFSLPEVSRKLKELNKKLPKNFSSEIKKFCRDCKPDICLKDFPKNLPLCEHLKKKLETVFPEMIVEDTIAILKCNQNYSSYVEEEIRDNFTKDRGEASAILQYMAYMETLK